MGDAGLEACSLRAFWNKPAHFCPQENVLFSECLFWPMSAPAKHLHLSFSSSLLSSTHPFSDRPNSRLLCSPLFPSTQDSLSAARLWRTDGIRNVKSACVLTQRTQQSFAGGSTFFLCVFLSAPSWNYLGAKLIALDPTSHCNRLSANLGFSRCSQVSPRQRGHTEQPTALLS